MKLLKYLGYAIMGIIGLISIGLVILEWPIWPRSFEREVWLESSSDQRGNNPRLTMADDLISKNILIGLTREAVLELLGDPGENNYFSSYDLVYWLGPERSFIRIDSEWLAITIGKDGLVVENVLVRD